MTDEYEYTLQCPDGEVWADQVGDLDGPAGVRKLMPAADVDCGCETWGHVIVRRPIGQWEKVS